MSTTFDPSAGSNNEKRSFLQWYVNALHEGTQVETLPCKTYCGSKKGTLIKTEEVFNQCLSYCAAAQEFARWHRLN